MPVPRARRPAPAAATASDGRLIAAIVASVAVVVLLIVVARLHPFFSLFLGSVVMALAGGIAIQDTVSSFTDGLGTTIGGTGVLIAFGATTGVAVAVGRDDQEVSRDVERLLRTLLLRVHGPTQLGEGHGDGDHDRAATGAALVDPEGPAVDGDGRLAGETHLAGGQRDAAVAGV